VDDTLLVLRWTLRYSRAVTTRGIEKLKEERIPFQVLTYAPNDAKGARAAAGALALPEEITVKSLVFQADDRSYLFALMASDGTVSEKKLARVAGRRRVSPALPRDAERVTGYEIGGISPLGAKRPLPVVLDREAAAHPDVAINAGARGTLVRLATPDLIRITGAVVADIRVE